MGHQKNGKANSDVIYIPPVCRSFEAEVVDRSGKQVFIARFPSTPSVRVRQGYGPFKQWPACSRNRWPQCEALSTRWYLGIVNLGPRRSCKLRSGSGRQTLPPWYV